MVSPDTAPRTQRRVAPPHRTSPPKRPFPELLGAPVPPTLAPPRHEAWPPSSPCLASFSNAQYLIGPALNKRVTPCVLLGCSRLRALRGVGFLHMHNLCRVLSISQISRSVVFDSSRPHELQHARPPCPSPTPGVRSNSRPSSQ